MAPDRFPVLRRLSPLLKWRYLVLVAAAFAFSLQHLRGTGEDWHFFQEGSELLFGVHHGYSPLPGGLHMYANYPDLQIGPLSFLLATPFRLLGAHDGRVVAALVMTAVAPGLVFILERTGRAVWTERDERSDTLLSLTVFLGGILVVQAWSPLATIYAHLDDVLVLSAGVVAVWAVARRRPEIVGVAIGLGIAAKPWGVVALPLVFALSGRGRWRALLMASGISAVVWLPFVLADAQTLSAIKPAVLTDPASVLHLFGVPLAFGPDWVRPVQLGAALLVGCLAVWRGRWGAVLLVGIAVRVGLDPGVFLYYAAGLVLAAFVWDVLRSPSPLPVWTLAVFLLLNDAYLLAEDPDARAIMRLAVVVAVVATATLGRTRTESTTTMPGHHYHV